MEAHEGPKVGQIFADKYRIERELGQGGMSAVYVAMNVALQAQVALKVISPKLGAQPEAVQRFAREGVATSRVRHRAIIQIFDAGEDRGMPWLAMELLPGETLAERTDREGPLPAAEVVRIAGEIASALVAVHQLGIIHRDLKPQNIFLDSSEKPPQPKVLDFGIAKLTDLGLERLTRDGTAMGTPHYMAPEQARGESDMGPAVDFWALGVIMLEAVSGHLPYKRAGLATYMINLATRPPRSVHELAPSVPPRLGDIISWCLAARSEDRPPDATALVDALEALSAELAHESMLPGGGARTELGMPAALRDLPTSLSKVDRDAPTADDALGAATQPSAPMSELDPSIRTDQGTPFTSPRPAEESPEVDGFGEASTEAVESVESAIPSSPRGAVEKASIQRGASSDPSDKSRDFGDGHEIEIGRPEDTIGPGAIPSGTPAQSETQAVEARRRTSTALFVVLGVALLGTCGVGSVITVSAALRNRDAAGEIAPVPANVLPASPSAPSPVEKSPARPEPPPNGSRSVLVDSVPRDADIFINGEPTGKRTPTTLTLTSGARIAVRKRGYRQYIRRLQADEREVVLRLQKAPVGRGKRRDD